MNKSLSIVSEYAVSDRIGLDFDVAIVSITSIEDVLY